MAAPPGRITKGPGDQRQADMVPDGGWIYFAYDQGPRHDSWRVLVTGGSPERVTRGRQRLFALGVDGWAGI